MSTHRIPDCMVLFLGRIIYIINERDCSMCYTSWFRYCGNKTIS